MKILHLAALAAALLATPAAAQNAPLLHTLFQDHAVLQRDRPIAIWGKAKPGETVQVTLAGKSADVRAARDGSWRAELPAMPAGGPFTLTAAAGGATQTVSDVLVGDVWLCSGQSNMEWPVAASINGPGEVNNSNDPQTRILTIEHDTAVAPARDFIRPVAWKPVSKDTIGDFSAVCWFMARELRKTEKVPFGLIDASWGGTAVNAWRSEASMKDDPALKEPLALLALARRDAPAAAKQWATSWGEWWRKRTSTAAGAEPWQQGAPGSWKPVPQLTYWEGWGVPELAGYNGIVWYRTEVELTAEQATKAAEINFGVIDDLDMTFINGIGVGSTSSWDAPRRYGLAKGVLKPGRNLIVVGNYDSWGPGGMAGTADQRAIRFGDGTSVPLPEASGWQYMMSPGISDLPHAPWESAAGLASIYNGMVAPLGNYGLRGIAWYQGEADAGMTAGYAGRLQGMIGGWREQFGNKGLPFITIQLPQWGARVPKPAESGFADIRNEQRIGTAGTGNAALVVTIDIGDWEDLHPVNKQDVATRAARAARFLTYGGKERPAGPAMAGAWREGGNVIVRFEGMNGELQAFSGAPLGFELCAEARGTCRFVPARLVGETVVLEGGDGPANRVRYCWGDSPVCNLYDSLGLPAGPFERAVEPR
jgi:sialate O-acetylesterase